MKKHSVTSSFCISLLYKNMASHILFYFVLLVFSLSTGGRAIPLDKALAKAQKPACAHSRTFYRISLLSISDFKKLSLLFSVNISYTIIIHNLVQNIQ